MAATVSVHTFFTTIVLDYFLSPYSFRWHICCTIIPLVPAITNIEAHLSQNISHFLGNWFSVNPFAHHHQQILYTMAIVQHDCSTYPIMFVISFWMRGVKYVAFFLEGFSIFSRKGSFVSANNLRMDKKLPGFWLLLISSLCLLNAMHCLTQSMFTLINHFKISLFLRTFSAFKLSVEYGNVLTDFQIVF